MTVVETVEPIILGTRVKECHSCACNCTVNEFNIELPESIGDSLGGDVSNNAEAPKLYISFGLFSVVRIVRPAQLLVQASDYSVPDKECVAATNDEDPCSVFRAMPFPSARFRGNTCTATNTTETATRNGRGGCCGNR